MYILFVFRGLSGDRGYIFQKLFEDLFEEGIQLNYIRNRKPRRVGEAQRNPPFRINALESEIFI